MKSSLDIFHIDADGSPLWKDQARNLEEARQRAQELASALPGNYLILDRTTGSKFIVKMEGSNGANGS